MMLDSTNKSPEHLEKKKNIRYHCFIICPQLIHNETHRKNVRAIIWCSPFLIVGLFIARGWTISTPRDDIALSFNDTN